MLTQMVEVRDHHDNHHDLFHKTKNVLLHGFGESGWALDRTSILFKKSQFYWSCFAALRISIDLMLSSPNLLYRHRKFIEPFHHFSQFKVNPVSYYSETMLIHLEQIRGNVSAMLNN